MSSPLLGPNPYLLDIRSIEPESTEGPSRILSPYDVQFKRLLRQPRSTLVAMVIDRGLFPDQAELGQYTKADLARILLEEAGWVP